MSSKLSSIDKSVFIPSVIIAGLIGLGFVYQNELMAEYTALIDGGIKKYIGWLYLLFGVGLFFYALWLAFGRHGSVKLGEANESPEFSTPHWVAMMFTAGIGAGLVTWAFGEPIYYLNDPPFGIEPLSSEAYEWAHMYPLVHWGFVPWSFYAVAAVPIAYSLYVLKRPFLRISEACEDALPRAGRSGSKILIDVCVILGIIAGTTTSLGIGVPLLSAMTSELTGMEDGRAVKVTILIIWVILFGASTLRGLKRGIQKLADLNMILAGILLLAMLVIGPTLFILNMTTNSIGLMADKLFRIILWTDPIEKSGFPELWTVFYWAWWVAFAAFVGLFIARISRGRTIKNVVLGTIIWGSLGTMSYLSIAGGYALHLQQSNNETLPLTQILNEHCHADSELAHCPQDYCVEDHGAEAHGLAVMTAKIAANMPFGKVSLVFFMILCTIFYATTMDSAAYIAAGVSSKKFDTNKDPPLPLRFAWIGILFLMTLGVVIKDSLNTVMAITIIGSVPLLPILLLMCISLTRQLNKGHNIEQEKP